MSLRDIIFIENRCKHDTAGVPLPQTSAGSLTAIRVSGLHLQLPRVNSWPESPNPRFATLSFCISQKGEGLSDLPPDGPQIKSYFATFPLKFAGGSNNDRGGSLNCKLVS